MTRVGIEALYVYSPEYYVDNAELAVARGKEPKHFTEGVGVKAFAVPPPNEDQASMAATAAHRLMETYGISPSDIFRIDTPTESGLDASRALVSDVVGMLEQVYGKGSLSHVLGYEQKFACVSGMERYMDTQRLVRGQVEPQEVRAHPRDGRREVQPEQRRGADPGGGRGRAAHRERREGPRDSARTDRFCAEARDEGLQETGSQDHRDGRRSGLLRLLPDRDEGGMAELPVGDCPGWADKAKAGPVDAGLHRQGDLPQPAQEDGDIRLRLPPDPRVEEPPPLEEDRGGDRARAVPRRDGRPRRTT